jgi:L-lactate dehydrogenase (cytochrome)
MKFGVSYQVSYQTVLTSEAYEPIHPPDAIQNNLPIEKQRVVFFLEYPMKLILALHSIGAIDPNTVVKVIKEVTEEDKRRQALMDARPPLDEILNLHDFEVSSLLILNMIYSG